MERFADDIYDSDFCCLNCYAFNMIFVVVSGFVEILCKGQIFIYARLICSHRFSHLICTFGYIQTESNLCSIEDCFPIKIKLKLFIRKMKKYGKFH